MHGQTNITERELSSCEFWKTFESASFDCCLRLKVKELRSIRTLETILPTIQHHISEHLILHFLN